jgi:NCS1 family nucleobase:cation symporter-1
MANLGRSLKGGLRPAKGAENAHGEDMWLDNDDIRPLKLEDRTWNLWTYLTFWFSASEYFYFLESLHAT